MTLKDIYQTKYLSQNDISGRVFYISPITGIDYRFLNSIEAPSDKEIFDYQLQNINNLYPQSSALISLVNKLNLDKMTSIKDIDDRTIEDGVKAIETAFGQWYETTNEASLGYKENFDRTISKDVIAGIQVDLNLYQQMLTNLQNVYDMLSSKEFLSSDFIKTRLDQINIAISTLQSDIASYKAGSFVPHEMPQNKGYVANAIALGHDLKGKYVEIVGTTWIQERVPSNIKVLDVGAVKSFTIDIFGGMKSQGKMLRTDIMAFDENLAKNIMVSYKLNGVDKNNVPLTELIKDIEKGHGSNSIVLPGDADQFAKIKEAIVFGGQAKAGQGQAIFNKIKKGTTINQITAQEMASNYGKALRLLVQLYTVDHAHIHQVHLQYQAMFNYLLGKYLNNIIGRENDLVVTRYGIQTIYNYFKDEYQRSQRLVRAYNNVNISMPDKSIVIAYTALGRVEE